MDQLQNILNDAESHLNKARLLIQVKYQKPEKVRIYAGYNAGYFYTRFKPDVDLLEIEGLLQKGWKISRLPCTIIKERERNGLAFRLE